jgi:hypothetical protein
MFDNAGSFKTLYRSLLKELSKIDIFDIGAYCGYKDAGDYFCDREQLKSIEVAFVEKLLQLIVSHEPLKKDVLSFVITDISPKLLDSHKSKCIIYSDKTYIKSKEIELAEFDSTQMETDFAYGPDLRELLEIIFQNQREVKSGVLVPVPEKIHWRDLEKYDQTLNAIFHNKKLIPAITGLNPFEIYEKLNANEPIEAYAAGKLSTKIFTPLEGVLELSLNSSAFKDNTEFLKLGLKAPSFEDVPPNIAQQLRTDYGDAFKAFQMALLGLCRQFEDDTDEDRLKLIKERVEHETNELNKEIRKIKNIHRKIQIGIGSITAILALKLSPEAVTAVSTAFSGLATTSMWEMYRSQRDIQSRIEKSPFYFPFLLQKHRNNMQ